MDTLLSPILDDLRACLCANLAGTLAGTPACACTLMPGAVVPADWCSCSGRGESCGMAWVRLSDAYASTSFPSPDGTTRGNCAAVAAAVLEVGVYRCQPAMSPQGAPPTPAQQTQAALVAADDAMAMFKTVTCCPSITARPHVVGRYTPRDGGACGGGVWTVTVSLLRR